MYVQSVAIFGAVELCLGGIKGIFCADAQHEKCVPQCSRRQLGEASNQYSVCTLIFSFVSALLSLPLSICAFLVVKLYFLSLCIHAFIPTHSFTAAYLPVIQLESQLETRRFFYEHSLYTQSCIRELNYTPESYYISYEEK